MAEAAKSMLNFLNIESIVVCCLRFNIYNTTTATDKRTQHRHHIGLNRISFSRSLESQDKVTKSIVFAPKLPRVGLNAKCDESLFKTGVTKKHQKFLFEYWVFSQKSYLNMWCFEKVHICIPKIPYLHT